MINGMLFRAGRGLGRSMFWLSLSCALLMGAAYYGAGQDWPAGGGSAAQGAVEHNSPTLQGPNLLSNGSFEEDQDADGKPDGWTARAAIARSSAAKFAGSYSMRHRSSDNAGYSSGQRVTGIVPGASYSFSAWTNIPTTGDAFSYQLELAWKDGANSTLRVDVLESYSAATGGWVQASDSFSAPPGAASVKVRMKVASLSATVYADKLELRQQAATPAPTCAVATCTPTPSSTATTTRTPTGSSTPTRSRTATSTPTPTGQSGGPAVLEPFEGDKASWQVLQDSAGTGASITRSTLHAADGSSSARLATGSQAASARLRINFSDAATDHQWQERPGTWRWQQASVYLPASTVAALGPSDSLTLAAMWPSAGGSYGWELRLHQGGALYLYGYTADGNLAGVNLYGSFPQDRWVELELGLHTQAGPGVKRAFAVVIDGQFYGWYRQGHMVAETYDRIAIGLLATSSAATLELYVDQWRVANTSAFPAGPDLRPSASVQEQDFRSQSGVQVQHDWSTWQNQPTLHSQHGLYTPVDRLQSGRNIDRMPNLTSGWAEIEIAWPQGQPATSPSSYFGPMVGFRKEVNREQNLEVIPIGKGGGAVSLVFEAWTGEPVVLAEWPLPLASIGGGSHIPEPGDIIRVRWEQLNASSLSVRASYYDASAGQWHTNVIDNSYNIAAINGVDYTDGYHTMSSITIDSSSYAIRRFKVGTLETYP